VLHAAHVGQLVDSATLTSRFYCVCGAIQALARSVRCAAYSTAAALLRSTQSKANLFAPAFKGSKQ
jgi:hypothetical protein